MVVKRKKYGNTTVTINTKTGRQTTSRRTGNITHSQSNQGHTRSTVTTNYGNGWFDRKTTNWDKKKRAKKSDWSWLFGDGKTSRSVATTNSKVEKIEKPKEEKPIFVGPPFPVFWIRKRFKDFSFFEWIKWLMALPFRVTWFVTKWTIIIYICIKVVQLIASVI